MADRRTGVLEPPSGHEAAREAVASVGKAKGMAAKVETFIESAVFGCKGTTQTHAWG